MLSFPKISSGIGLSAMKMPLRDYARFSEHCLRSNATITPENCLAKRASEKTMTRPFLLRSPKPVEFTREG
jgi:hypothetical protein